MQQHGAPTRMLDWSESPFVAAYFAVLSNEDKPGAIWCVEIEGLEEAMAPHGNPHLDLPKRSPAEALAMFRDPEPSRIVSFIHPLVQTERMVAQRLVCSITTHVHSDHQTTIEERLREAKREKWMARKFIVPAALKSGFFARLRTMNVTAQVLFPGIDGLGRSVAEWVELWRGFREGRPADPR